MIRLILGIFLSVVGAGAFAQTPMVPNGGSAFATYKALICTNTGGNTACTSSDGLNSWACSTAQPAVCTVPSTLTSGSANVTACNAGHGGGGGQASASTAGGGGGGGGACIENWPLQLTPGAQINIQVGVPGTGAAPGNNATGSAGVVTTITGLGLINPFPSLTSNGGNGNAGAAGTGGTGGAGDGIGNGAGGAAGGAGAGVTAVRGPHYIPAGGGGGGGATAGTAGNGGAITAFVGGLAGSGNGAGGGGGGCWLSSANAGGVSGSNAPAPSGYCAGGGGGGSNANGANGSPAYFVLGAIW